MVTSRRHTMVATTVGVGLQESVFPSWLSALFAQQAEGWWETEQGPRHLLWEALRQNWPASRWGLAGMRGTPRAGIRTRSWNLGQQLRLLTQVRWGFPRENLSCASENISPHLHFCPKENDIFYPQFLRVFLVGVVNTSLCLSFLARVDSSEWGVCTM